jgi:hypothetical protein
MSYTLPNFSTPSGLLLSDRLPGEFGLIGPVHVVAQDFVVTVLRWLAALLKMKRAWHRLDAVEGINARWN